MGTAGLLGWHPRRAAAEPPPETTRIRLIKYSAICIAPQYVAEELLRSEGFTEVQYVKKESIVAKQMALAAGEVDLISWFSGPFLLQLEAGDPLVLLAGMHVGCFELFGTERVHAIRDLKGKTVAVDSLRTPDYVFLASMAAYVGLDPRQDIHWVVAHPFAEAVQLACRQGLEDEEIQCALQQGCAMRHVSPIGCLYERQSPMFLSNVNRSAQSLRMR